MSWALALSNTIKTRARAWEKKAGSWREGGREEGRKGGREGGEGNMMRNVLGISSLRDDQDAGPGLGEEGVELK